MKHAVCHTKVYSFPHQKFGPLDVQLIPEVKASVSGQLLFFQGFGCLFFLLCFLLGLSLRLCLFLFCLFSIFSAKRARERQMDDIVL